MVFVTLGTQKHSFIRIISKVLKSDILKDKEIIIQYGYTNIDNLKIPNNIKVFDFVDENKFNEYVKDSEYVITHAGVGCILSAVKKDKKVITIPRLDKYDEHINNHQLQIARKFEKMGFVLYLKENQNLDSKIKDLDSFKIKKYNEDTKYLDKIQHSIDNLL